MIIRTFSAPTMAEVMALVRQELGDEAVIISSQKTEGKVRVTATLEEEFLPSDKTGEEDRKTEGEVKNADIFTTLASHKETVKETVKPRLDLNPIYEALEFHKVPEALSKKIYEAASASRQEGVLKILEEALGKVFTFTHLPNTKLPKTFLLMGTAGVGKTMLAAKLAAKARMDKFSVAVITTDFVKTGAVSELGNVMKILNVPFAKARNYMELADKIELFKQSCDFIYIDTPAVNTLDKTSMASIANFAILPDICKVLVMQAGTDVDDAIEAVCAFTAYAAPEFILPTKIDTTRRLGSILAAADTAQLKFCDISLRASLVRAVCPITPLSLARLMLPEEYSALEE